MRTEKKMLNSTSEKINAKQLRTKGFGAGSKPEDQTPNLYITEPQNPQNSQIVPIKAGFTQFEVINAIYDSKILSEVKLTAGARLVLISLARHYNPSNDEFFPSYACISSHTGVSKKSVERAIKELVGAGLITYRTEKVNRYRFTGRFFACVKMTLNHRQNDACALRQNDDQTNNHEKIINNKKIINFNFSNAKVEKSKEPQSRLNIGNSEFISNTFQQKIEMKSNNPQSDEKGKNPPPARQNDVNLGQEPLKADVLVCPTSCSTLPAVAANAKTQAPKSAWNASRPWSSSSSQKTNYAKYTVPPSERKGGSSFTPSVLATDNYLKSLRQARSEACSPLEFDYAAAKAWYSSLALPLRASNMAKKIVAKYPQLLDEQ